MNHFNFYARVHYEYYKQIEDQSNSWIENHTFYGVFDGIQFEAEQLLSYCGFSSVLCGLVTRDGFAELALASFNEYEIPDYPF